MTKSKRKSDGKANDNNGSGNNSKKQDEANTKKEKLPVKEPTPPPLIGLSDRLTDEDIDDTSLWPTPNINNVRLLDVDLSLSDDSSPPSMSTDHYDHNEDENEGEEVEEEEEEEEEPEPEPDNKPPAENPWSKVASSNPKSQNTSRCSSEVSTAPPAQAPPPPAVKNVKKTADMPKFSSQSSRSDIPVGVSMPQPSKEQTTHKPTIQVQRFDNTTIRTLVAEETKSHLIIDDEERLMVKSAAEFIALFPNASDPYAPPKSSPVHSSASSSSEDGAANPSKLGLNSSQHNQSTMSAEQMIRAAAALVDDKLVKCVSIFGNTGDGKSHSLNHAFFDGRPIFRTWHKQETCTVGVWCAYDARTNALIFDTEGLLGETANENKRMRLLLKVLAISDVVIYRTRGERLHNDLFKFLSDASVAYLKYFSKELKVAAAKLKLDTISSLGPCCVIFHETQHTECLSDEVDPANRNNVRTVSHQIADRFAKLDASYNAFSSIDYVGTRTCFVQSQTLLNANVTTDFTKLSQAVRGLLKNNSVRPPRKLSSIYHVFKVLNDKFNGIISKNQVNTFADEYFTCSSVCLSCGKRCQNSINHLKDSIVHENNDKCHYDHQYDNRVYVCKFCHEAGKEIVVIPKTAATNENSLIGIVKYAVSGFVLECPHHGIIYRSRQYWYGNQDPESVVRTELKHIWSGQQNHVGTSHNLSRKIIDGVSYLGESLHSVSAKPTKLAMQWMSDQVAPSYWTPNSEIIACFKCEKPFIELLEKKHHCRGCGKGFCDKCSSKRMIINWWSPTDKVRVCDACCAKTVIPEPMMPSLSPSRSMPQVQTDAHANHAQQLQAYRSSNGGSPSNDVTARKVTETVQETIGYIGYATKLPFDVLKESARPSYWKPDSECIKCSLCKREFDDLLPLHHCRSCGNGVCNKCSPHLRPVPSRGWDTPVRVCDNCISNETNT